jgi:L-phenylalanine/L-methionine N-acetyltransferase
MTTTALNIRRASSQDAAAFARIMGEPQVLRDLMQLPYASEEQWRARLTEMLAPGKPDLILVAERTGPDGQAMVVGHAGLNPAGAALRRRHVVSLGIAVASAAQGQGVGNALMQALCDYADRWAQVLRIELTVYADNGRAIGLYRRFGFVEEGRMRAYALRDGLYVDALAMARLHPDPPRLPAP